MVGNLVEPPPRGQFGVTAERAHTSAEGRPSQNGGVPHRQQGSGMHPDQGGGYGIGFTAAGGDPGANVRG